MPKALKPVGRPVLRTTSTLEHEKDIAFSYVSFPNWKCF